MQALIQFKIVLKDGKPDIQIVKKFITETGAPKKKVKHQRKELGGFKLRAIQLHCSHTVPFHMHLTEFHCEQNIWKLLNNLCLCSENKVANLELDYPFGGHGKRHLPRSSAHVFGVEEFQHRVARDVDGDSVHEEWSHAHLGFVVFWDSHLLILCCGFHSRMFVFYFYNQV